MDAFAPVDAKIIASVKAHGSNLFIAQHDRHRRYFHLPGDPPFECFQVVIEPPSAGTIIVRAFVIDTNDNTEDEMAQSWEGPVETLTELIETAIATIRVWQRRTRRTPDPHSPW